MLLLHINLCCGSISSFRLESALVDPYIYSVKFDEPTQNFIGRLPSPSCVSSPSICHSQGFSFKHKANLQKSYHNTPSPPSSHFFQYKHNPTQQLLSLSPVLWQLGNGLYTGISGQILGMDAVIAIIHITTVFDISLLQSKKFTQATQDRT